MVFSNDVLEHIEPNYLKEVLQDIDNYATKYTNSIWCLVMMY